MADAPQLAPSFSASNESADWWCRRWRQSKYVPATCALFLPARRFPTWFRWRKSGRRAESESGGDGLLANPRSRPTPLSDFRTPTSESVGWLLLLFAIEKQGKKEFFPKGVKGLREAFCCFSPPKSREKEKVFSCTFGAKSTKSLRTSFSAGVREPRRCTGRARSGLSATP